MKFEEIEKEIQKCECEDFVAGGFEILTDNVDKNVKYCSKWIECKNYIRDKCIETIIYKR